MTTYAKLVTFFEHGGIWMYPIVAINIAVLVIAVERFIFLYGLRKTTQSKMAGKFEIAIRHCRFDEILAALRVQPAQPLSGAIAAGVTAAKEYGGKDDIQNKMDEALLEEQAALQARTGFLAVFANVVTLTGLLGTISGMITSFSALANADAQTKAILLSNGISEAMNATAYGLVVAIPSLVAYAILMNRTQRLEDDLRHGALKIYNLLSFAIDNVPATASGRIQQSHGPRVVDREPETTV